MRFTKAIVAVLWCAFVLGCEQAQTVIVCGADSTDVVNAPSASARNQECLEHAECESAECVPTFDAPEGSAGVCWDDAFRGCDAVDFAAWVIDAFCGPRALAVCQWAPTAGTEAHCAPPSESMAPWVANFMCCDPSFL